MKEKTEKKNERSFCHSQCLNIVYCGAVFIMNSKIYLRENSSNDYFKTVSYCFRVYSRLEPHTVRSMNALVVFFAAFAEVQVAALLVLSRPRQGFSATCPIGHCCVCSPLLFATELLCDSPGNSPTHSKQRMNKCRGGRVAWKPEMHDDIMLNCDFKIRLRLFARQLRIPNR